MNLFDTHFHIDPSEKLSEFQERCAAAGVSRALACGSSFKSSSASATFAEAVPGCFFAAGVHPGELDSFKGDFAAFKAFSSSPKFVAIGEIGLDFYYDKNCENLQIDVLKGFLELALELDRPALIHCRDAEGRFEAYEILHSLLTPFVSRGGRFDLHCFAGTPEWADKFAALGGYFGVGGMITFKKAGNIREMAAGLPLDRILLETDSPYLAPVPFRGKPNHPAYLPLVAKALAALRGMGEDEISELAFANAGRLFNVR